MKKVLVFGCFDLLHEGHKFFFKEAKKHGDLHIVIARDSNILKIKKREPIHNESVRFNNVKALYNNVHMGHKYDFTSVIKLIKPDVICLGYDQNIPRHINIYEFCNNIIRLSSFKPHVYKSTLLRDKYEK